jgi:CRP-like cAMP-binding protein
MREALIQYIKSRTTTPLSENDMETLNTIFVPKRLRKRQFLLQAGEVCKYTGFLVKGAMRQYSVDEKGIEHVVELSIEEWWVGDRESFVNLTPSLFYIDAWENSDLLLLSRDDYFNKLKPIPAVVELSGKLDERHAFAMQRKVNAFISMSAEERYNELLHTYPEFLQRFPQHIVASYLGITKETLSRIRHHAVNR